MRSKDFVPWLHSSNRPCVSTATPYNSCQDDPRLADVTVTMCLPARSKICVRLSEFTKTLPLPSTQRPVAEGGGRASVRANAAT